MGSLSDYAENALLDHLLNNISYTPAATVYLALATGDPTDAATGASMNEVANSNNYGRTAISFGAAAIRKVVQSGAVTFPQASGAWGTITHWVIVTSATHGAGNALAHGLFSASFAPVSGNTPTVPNMSVEVEILATATGAGLSNYAVHKLLDRMFRNQAFSPPATYVGLATATIADDDVADTDLTEPSGGSYARKLVNPNGGSSPTWDLASGGIVDNTHAITFVTPTGSWGLVTSAFLIDSASGAGNVLGYDNANIVDQTPVADDTVTFPVGDFDVIMT